MYSNSLPTKLIHLNLNNITSGVQYLDIYTLYNLNFNANSAFFMIETKQNYTGCDSKKQVGPKRPTFHKKALHKSHYPWTQRQVMWPNAIVEYALIELNRKVSSEKISFMNKEYNIEERFIAMKKEMKLFF